jgi:CO dehydrogenase nickel-insertion accessory protein CooC1
MMFLVALPSVQDVLTAKRIRNLAIDLQLNIKGIGLIVNSVRDGILDKVKESIERDFDGYYKVPYDDEVDELNSLGEPLLGVSKGSIAYRAVGEILRRAQ